MTPMGADGAADGGRRRQTGRQTAADGVQHETNELGSPMLCSNPIDPNRILKLGGPSKNSWGWTTSQKVGVQQPVQHPVQQPGRQK